MQREAGEEAVLTQLQSREPGPSHAGRSRLLRGDLDIAEGYSIATYFRARSTMAGADLGLVSSSRYSLDECRRRGLPRRRQRPHPTGNLSPRWPTQRAGSTPSVRPSGPAQPRGRCSQSAPQRWPGLGTAASTSSSPLLLGPQTAHAGNGLSRGQLRAETAHDRSACRSEIASTSYPTTVRQQRYDKLR